MFQQWKILIQKIRRHQQFEAKLTACLAKTLLMYEAPKADIHPLLRVHLSRSIKFRYALTQQEGIGGWN